jgi:hypothetical protein
MPRAPRCFDTWNDEAGDRIVFATFGLPPSPDTPLADVAPLRIAGLLFSGHRSMTAHDSWAPLSVDSWPSVSAE